MNRRTLFALVAVLALAAAAWFTFLRPEPREVTTDSSVAYAAYERGLAEREKIFWNEAAQAFEEAVAADSNFAMAWLELAGARRNLDDEDGYRQAMERAWALRDEVTELERLRIDYARAVQEKDMERSSLVLEEMEQKYPDDPMTLYLVASRAWSEGNRDRAIQLFERLLEVDPSRVMSHNNLGYLYLQKGDYEEAIANLRRYAYYAPDQPNPHDSLGEAYEAAGRYDDAIQEFLKALEIRPSFYHSALHLASALAVTGQVERARFTLDQAESALEKLGMNTRVIPIYRIEIEGLGLQRERTVALAEKTIAQADPEAAGYEGLMLNAWTAKAFALLELERLDQAEAAMDTVYSFWKAALEEMPAEYKGRQRALGTIIGGLLQARLALGRGRPWKDHAADVATVLEKVEMAPHELAPWRHNLAKVYFLGGEYDHALEQVDTVRRHIPDYPYVNLLGARTLAELGRQEMALDLLAAYLQVMRHADDDHPGIQKARELYAKLAAG
jgi:tetratricopeptide (TPR) repeat protein